MLTPKERSEKIRSAPKNSRRFLKVSREEYEKHVKRALEHEKDGGLSSVDEYVFLKHKEADGK